MQPVMVGKVAAQIQRENEAFVLREISTYVDDSVLELKWKVPLGIKTLIGTFGIRNFLRICNY